MHAKTFAFDRRIGFIGSYNLDPRSSKLNTEMGVLFDCPELVKRLAEATGRDIDRNTYRVELVGNHLSWLPIEDLLLSFPPKPTVDLMHQLLISKIRQAFSNFCAAKPGQSALQN